ncbi:zf-U1-domain-containing protein [Saccharata proteae CBS 121410]|uniref:U1 small nuclear ribonucleoprotein C n=1 Tax=Saccharata proteae CBS 121410 TaxID=1314787 RepID=A0A9P4I2F7_9PEZI|nr:zf-U1-domain-containing protein [Saccharata proteae CBS 121410]
MPKYKCSLTPPITRDYCDVYLTHDSMSVRKAHNSGRNHLRNVVEYYQRIYPELLMSVQPRAHAAAELNHERAQTVIDDITSSYAAEGQAAQNPMLQFGGMPGPGGFPPPFGFPGGAPPPPFGMPPGGPLGRGMPPVPPNMPFPPPNMGPGQMPFPPFPPNAGSPAQGMPFPPPGGVPPPGGMPPNFAFPPNMAPPPGGFPPPGMVPPPHNAPPGL